MMRLSIVTISLNEFSNIEKTIKSILTQTYTDYEFIIIDGASTDGTLEIINKYKDRIDVLISEKDNGIYNAMNKGIRNSSGEYIMFINGGDYFYNNKVLENIFKFKPTSDIIFGDGYLEFSNSFILRKKYPKKITKLHMLSDTVPHQDSLTKRIIFDKTEGFDEEYIIAADYEFFLKALYQYNCSIEYLPFGFAVNSMTGVSNQKRFEKIKKNERKIAQKKYFSNKLIMFYPLFKPFHFVFVKYLKYVFDILHSIKYKYRTNFSD